MASGGVDDADAELAGFFAVSSEPLAIVDNAGRFARLNPAFGRVLGYAPADLVGTPWVDILHPDDQPAAAREWSRLAEDLPRMVMECRCAHKLGAWVWLHWTLHWAPERNLLYAMARDLSGRKLASELLGRVFHLCPVPLIIASPGGVIIEVNESFLKLTGLDRDDAVGCSALTLLVVDDEQRRSVVERLLTAGQVRDEEVTLRTRAGKLRAISVSLDLAEIEGRTLAIAGFLDVTDRKIAESELRQKNLQLVEAIEAERATREALRSAQSALVQTEKLASLGQLVAGVAHEINNPLAYVSNNVAVLKRDVEATRSLLAIYQEADEAIGAARPDLAGRVAERADEIDLGYVDENLPGLFGRTEKGLSRIQKIVDNLMVFARVEGSDRAETDLNDGIVSTLDLCTGRAKKRKVKLEADLGHLPRLAVHPVKINQVVLNLVSNAIDVSPDGGTVTVRTRCDGAFVQIDVVDRGEGIDAEVAARIFDPFFTTKPVGAGTGLGLSISYGIVKEHQGFIEVDSRKGQGTTFTVRLPLRPSRVQSL